MHRLTLLLLASWALSAQTETEWLNRGVQAFKNGRSAAAVEAFEQAVAVNPGSVAAHLYLGTAQMQQYIPGAESPDDDRIAAGARRNASRRDLRHGRSSKGESNERGGGAARKIRVHSSPSHQ